MDVQADNVIYEDNERREKGGAPLERFTIDFARQVVGDVIRRVEEGTVARKKKSDEDEIDDLVAGLDEEEDTDVEEDDDVEDEVEEDDEDVEEVDDEEDDEEEDPDEAPTKRSRSKKSSAKKSSKAKRDGIGTKEVAEAAGVDQRSLRMYLRAKGFQPRDDREGRYTWKSLNDKEVQRIIKGITSGELKKQQQAKLDDLKGRKKSKKAPAKKSSKRRAKAKA